MAIRHEELPSVDRLVDVITTTALRGALAHRSADWPSFLDEQIRLADEEITCVVDSLDEPTARSLMTDAFRQLVADRQVELLSEDFPELSV